MPWFGYRYYDRGAACRAEEERAAQKRRDSWERMKAQVAARYVRS